MVNTEDNEYKVIAQRYAKALMDFAGDKTNLTKEDLLAQISDIKESFENSEELKKMIASPIVSKEEKKKVIAEIFGQTINPLVLNFLKLLIDKDRFNIFNSIVKEFKNEVNRQNGFVEIKIISAIDLSESEKAMIKVKLEKVLNKEISLDWATNSSIIGGLIFEYGDNIVDCSLQHKLQEITKEIIV